VCPRGISTLTSLRSLLVHDTMSAFSAANGLPRLDVIFGTTVFLILTHDSIRDIMLSHQHTNTPSPASEGVKRPRWRQRRAVLVDSSWFLDKLVVVVTVVTAQCRVEIATVRPSDGSPSLHAVLCRRNNCPR
jgi:hypothetical protein